MKTILAYIILPFACIGLVIALYVMVLVSACYELQQLIGGNHEA